MRHNWCDFCRSENWNSVQIKTLNNVFWSQKILLHCLLHKTDNVVKLECCDAAFVLLCHFDGSSLSFIKDHGEYWVYIKYEGKKGCVWATILFIMRFPARLTLAFKDYSVGITFRHRPKEICSIWGECRPQLNYLCFLQLHHWDPWLSFTHWQLLWRYIYATIKSKKLLQIL